jgi:hypothetical protein
MGRRGDGVCTMGRWGGVAEAADNRALRARGSGSGRRPRGARGSRRRAAGRLARARARSVTRTSGAGGRQDLELARPALGRKGWCFHSRGPPESPRSGPRRLWRAGRGGRPVPGQAPRPSLLAAAGGVRKGCISRAPAAGAPRPQPRPAGPSLVAEGRAVQAAALVGAVLADGGVPGRLGCVAGGAADGRRRNACGVELQGGPRGVGARVDGGAASGASGATRGRGLQQQHMRAAYAGRHGRHGPGPGRTLSGEGSDAGSL